MLSDPGTLRLEVGGLAFAIPAADLSGGRARGSMLETLCSDRWRASGEDGGPIRIDRDGSRFPLLLQWLRTGDVHCLLNPADRAALLDDAGYYLLEGLVRDLCTAATHRERALSASELRQQAAFGAGQHLQGRLVRAGPGALTLALGGDDGEVTVKGPAGPLPELDPGTLVTLPGPALRKRPPGSVPTAAAHYSPRRTGHELFVDDWGGLAACPEAAPADWKAAGNEAFREKNPAAALGWYTLHLLHRADAVVLANRAAVHLALGQPLAATYDCAASLALDNGYVKASYQYGLALKDLEWWGESVRAFHLIRTQGTQEDRAMLAAVASSFPPAFPRASPTPSHLSPEWPVGEGVRLPA